MNWKQSFKQGHHSCYSLQESSGPFQVSSGFLWISYTISIPTRLNLKELEPFTAVIGTIKGRMKEAKCLKLNHGRLQRRCASWVVPTNRGWRGMHKKNVSEVHMRVINNIVLLFFIFRHAHVRMYVHTHTLSLFSLSLSHGKSIPECFLDETTLKLVGLWGAPDLSFCARRSFFHSAGLICRCSLQYVVVKGPKTFVVQRLGHQAEIAASCYLLAYITIIESY